MSANSLKQAVTSATSSVITLASAVSGFNAFTAVDDGIEQTYWVFEGDDFQICSGVYTHSGTTLAITHILQKSVSGVVEDLPATGLTLTSAAIVLVGGHGLNQIQHYQEGVNSDWSFKPHNNGKWDDSDGTGGGRFSALAGRIVIATCVFLWPVKITDVGCQITTTSAGGLFRIGLYHCDAQGQPGDLIFDSGDITTASVGRTFASLSSPIIIPAGVYYLASAVDNVVAKSRGLNPQEFISMTALGSNKGSGSPGETQLYYDQTYGAFPTNLPTEDGSASGAAFAGFFR